MVGRPIFIIGSGCPVFASSQIQSSSLERSRMAKQQRKIVAGPSLFDLAVRLFEGSSLDQRPVSFTLRGDSDKDFLGVNLPTWSESVKLQSAEREDGSGKNWNLTGYTVANSCKVEIFFNLSNREGWMTFLL